MKSFVFVLVVVLIGVAFGLGYWPQAQRLSNAQEELKQTRIQLEDAQARLRMFELQSRLLDVLDRVKEQNYGDAQALSTQFFDGVSAELARTPRAEFREALEAVARMRDAVTAGLTRGSADTLGLLNDALARLRRNGGKSAPPAAPAAPAKNN